VKHAQRSRQTNLESVAGGNAREAALNEIAQSSMKARAAFAIGTEAEVIVDAAAFSFAECAVEEEVENSFYIVTAHRSEPASF